MFRHAEHIKHEYTQFQIFFYLFYNYSIIVLFAETICPRVGILLTL